MRKHSTKYRYYHLYTIATAATTRSWIAAAVVLYGAYNYCCSFVKIASGCFKFHLWGSISRSFCCEALLMYGISLMMPFR